MPCKSIIIPYRYLPMSQLIITAIFPFNYIFLFDIFRVSSILAIFELVKIQFNPGGKMKKSGLNTNIIAFKSVIYLTK